MKNVFAKLASDFFSTIVFLAVYLISDNVLLATGVAIVSSVAQVAWAHFKGEPLGFMTYASLALVVVLGTATLVTNDPRFVLAKPAIAHFAIGAIMLKRGWMLRYMPPIVAETIPEYVTFAGYAWAALMFALGCGTIAIAMSGDIKLWALYVSFVLLGAKLAAFAIQYVAFRTPRHGADSRRPGLIPHFAWRRDRLYRRRMLARDHSGLREARETMMAVDGNWNITMSTPMGERKATLTLKNAGGTLTGTQGADGNSAEIFDGSAKGDDVAWKVSITNPMPLTLEFTGKVSGDSMTGEMGIGPMGSFPFTGTKA